MIEIFIWLVFFFFKKKYFILILKATDVAKPMDVKIIGNTLVGKNTKLSEHILL